MAEKEQRSYPFVLESSRAAGGDQRVAGEPGGGNPFYHVRTKSAAPNKGRATVLMYAEKLAQ